MRSRPVASILFLIISTAAMTGAGYEPAASLVGVSSGTLDANRTKLTITSTDVPDNTTVLYGPLSINFPSNQNLTLNYPYRGGTDAAAATHTSIIHAPGIIGITVAGLVMYAPPNLSIITVNGKQWYYDANQAKINGEDIYGGHCAGTGQYHYHDIAFVSNDSWVGVTGFTNGGTYGRYRQSDGHSKLLGWAADGYPVYGPYGYVKPTDAASGVQLMVSGYTATNTGANRPASVTATVVGAVNNSTFVVFGSDPGALGMNPGMRITTNSAGLASSTYYILNQKNVSYTGGGHPPYSGATNSVQLNSAVTIANGASLTFEYLPGLFVEDNTFTNTGTLDQYNGRYCVTPEFPNGTYVYFMTQDSSGKGVYPYLIGQSYYGSTTVSLNYTWSGNSGTWATGTSGWSAGVWADNNNVFIGSGTDTAGTITVSSTVNPAAITFGAPLSGVYTLAVNGTIATAGSIPVTSGATIRGSGGTINRTLRTNASGVVWPGAAATGSAVGTSGESLTVAGLDMSAGGTLKIGLNPTSTTSTQKLIITGTTVLGGTLSLSIPTGSAGSNIYTILSSSGSISGSFSTVLLNGNVVTGTEPINVQVNSNSVTVTVSKITPTITTAPTASTITYGQLLSASTLSGGVASVSGTFAFTTPSASPATGTSLQNVTFTPADTANYKTVTLNVNVLVNPATPLITVAPAAGAITYGQTLASSSLSGGTASVSGSFAFTNPSIAPSAGTAMQGITFTPTDATNYTTVSTSINVTVNKATPTITSAPTASAITYGQTLTSSILSGGIASVLGNFAFTNISTAPSAGIAAQGITFTPADTANYNAVSTTISVTVNKATPTITTLPTASTINEGQMLNASTLSGGVASVVGSFAFTTPSITPPIGTSNQSVTFTAADSANYETVTMIVSINVNGIPGKITPTITTTPSASAITFGQTLADSVLSGGVASVSGSFEFSAPTTSPNVGTASQNVTFTPSDMANFNSVSILVNVTVNKATPSITSAPTASTITYGQSLALSTLSGGAASVNGSFAFTTPSISPGAGTASQGVTFTPSDTTHYNTVTLNVNVTVNKATPTISVVPTASAITFEQTLASSVLTGGVANVNGNFSFTTPSTVPVAGIAAQSAIFAPSDANNYETLTLSVNVTVNKATPTISIIPTASAITYGQTLASSVLTAGVASVNGNFAFATPSTAPGAGTAEQSVRFAPNSSDNYNTVDLSVKVTVNKANPTITAVPTAKAITFGQMLSASILSGGAGSVPGGFEFTAPSSSPNAGTTAQSITFTPSDTANYNPTTLNVDVTVNKAIPAIIVAPSASAITYGQALSASKFSGGMASVPGSFALASSASVPDAGLVSLAFTFIPIDSPNYSNVVGSVSVTVLKKNLVATAASATRVYGASNPAFSGTLVGVVNNDLITANYTSTATPSTAVGTYEAGKPEAITPVLVNAENRVANYYVTSFNAALTITRAPATVTLSGLLQVYDGNAKSVTASTLPAGLPVNITYNGNIAMPKEAGSYAVSATVSDLNYDGSASGTLIINRTTITSATSATPNPVVVLKTVSFSAVGINSNNDPLVYTWDFGDGTLGSGASVSHNYLLAGVYRAVVTIDNGLAKITDGTDVTVVAAQALVGPGLDSDGDGFSDTFEVSIGSDPKNASITPMNISTSTGAISDLKVSKMQIKLNFLKSGSDSIAFAGTLAIPAGFNPKDTKVIIDVGGVNKSLTLTEKGTASDGDVSMKVSIKSVKGVVSAQTAAYSIRFNEGDFAATFAKSGLTSAAANSAPVTIPVVMLFNDTALQKQQSLLYSTKSGKTGIAK